ncbi:hypothetical protein ACE02S_14580 [Shewanella xiamenensis]|uniref:hypothetical protein n=1 Tax=Shewanella TaxID=22 RepID=UPI0006D9A772|nr:hypothetical protein [Shewanella sp. Sh95]KPN78461.1 hypothetical protein AEA42_02805 [Shewanella sp. Sh95]
MGKLFNKYLGLTLIFIPFFVSSNFEPAIKVFDTNDDIILPSVDTSSSKVISTKDGFLFTGINQNGFTSLYYFDQSATTPIEVDIPLANKGKFTVLDHNSLQKIGDDLYTFYIDTTDEMFYFNLEYKKLIKWDLYYKLKNNKDISQIRDGVGSQLFSELSWISYINDGNFIFARNNKVYSYNSKDDLLTKLMDGDDWGSELIQNNGSNIYFEYDGVLYNTDGVRLDDLYNYPDGEQAFVYRDSGDIVLRDKYNAPQGDFNSKGLFAISFGSERSVDYLYLSGEGYSGEIRLSGNYRFSSNSGIISNENSITFLIKKRATNYGDGYQIQTCNLNTSLTCKNINVLPEIAQGLDNVTLFKVDASNVLVNARYIEAGTIVETKMILVNLVTSEVKEVGVNIDKNVVADILAKSADEIFILTRTVLDDKKTLYKYKIREAKLSSFSIKNYHGQYRSGFIVSGRLFSLKRDVISENLLSDQKFEGLFEFDENYDLFNLIFLSNFGRNTGQLNFSGIHGVNKVNDGIVSSSIRNLDNNSYYAFMIRDDLTKIDIFNGFVNYWLDSIDGFIFSSLNNVSIFKNGAVRNLYSYNDSSNIKLFNPISYNKGNILFDNNYVLNVNDYNVFDVLKPNLNGYISSNPVQCGGGIFYLWSDSNGNSLWRSNNKSLSKIDLNGRDISLKLDYYSLSDSLLLSSYNKATFADDNYFIINCNDFTIKDISLKPNDATSVSIVKSEQGDSYAYVYYSDKMEIYYLNDYDFKLNKIYTTYLSDYFYPEYNMIHRTVAGFFYNYQYQFSNGNLVKIDNADNELVVASTGDCHSDADDPRGWMVCAVTIKNDNLMEDAIRIYDPKLQKHVYVKLSYLEPEANISNFTYSKGRYFFNANVVGIGYELLAIDQNCLIELDNGADNCTLPLPNSAPRIYSHEIESYYNGQSVYFPIRAVDEDLDRLTYKIIRKDVNWLSISNNGVLNGVIPNNEKPRVINLTIGVSDGNVEITKEIKLKILENNNHDNTDNPSTPPSDNGEGGGSLSLFLLFILYLVATYRRNSKQGSSCQF